MYFLYIFGNNLEEIFGRINYLFFYLLCGLSSGIIHTIFTFHPTILTLGASGAISGLMGAYVGV
jgi:hypothetical protein